ncbi:MAG: rod shape-determining protein MreD [Christensenellaceae bacterium]|jgi:rod shape-determining protein MreD
MRYVVLVLLGAVSALLSGTVLTANNTGGLHIDIVFLLAGSLMLREKSAMPIVFAALSGLLLDIFYSTVLGVYALSYTVSIAAIYIAIRNRKRPGLPEALITGAGGYAIRELMVGLIVYILGARFELGYMMIRYILPSMLVNAGLMMLFYWLMGKLLKNNWMRPRVVYDEDRLNF